MTALRRRAAPSSGSAFPPATDADVAARGAGTGRTDSSRPPGALVSDDARARSIRSVLASVPDPEIPVLSVVDLGIVRQVSPDRVAITPTYTGCPAARVIEQDIRAALDEAGFGDVRVDTILSPPWTTDWISEEGRRKLHAYGIAPPVPAGEKAVACPQCDSTDTEEISRFGSTPCKALWRCRTCAEPFDLFKCH